jgi:hypothetical protein
MRAAGRELRLRREGAVSQEANRASATRPFGSCSEKNLRKYAGSIDSEVSKLERRLEKHPDNVHSQRLVKAKNQRNNHR